MKPAGRSTAILAIVLSLLGTRLAAETVVLRTQGRSMMPVIKDGDSIRVDRSTDFASLKEGDLVVYRDTPQTLVSHRLVYRYSPTAWRARGVNLLTNRGCDPGVVTKENFYGKIVNVIRKS